MDLYSRKMVHREVHDTQSSELAAKFIEKDVKKVGFVKPSDVLIKTEGSNTDIFGKVLELHSDNGAPMGCSTMVAKCLELGISCTYNRPRHSNDNAHMEASFRLLKHEHEVAIPLSFDTLSQAREWCNQYYEWYHNIHRLSGICFVTPAQCYEGKGEEIRHKRNKLIEDFFECHKKQKYLIKNTGKYKTWKMPKSAVVMPFYSKCSKIKNKIRALRFDSGDFAYIGKNKILRVG